MSEETTDSSIEKASPAGTPPSSPDGGDAQTRSTSSGPAEDGASPESFEQIVSSVKFAYPTVRELLETGSHFGHQTRRWDPRMKPYLFGERNGVHIINLDQTKTLFDEALDFIRNVTSQGGKVLFVGTKRQAQPCILSEAIRSKQFYVNQRWLGGMLTNFKTVKNSVDRFKKYLDILGDPEKLGELTKREGSRIRREAGKLEKSLGGIKDMTRLPSALFVVGVDTEQIAVKEARRLGIPVVAIVDSNCNPDEIDFVIPGNDDATRAIALYCARVADACLDGESVHQAKLAKEAPAKKPTEEKAAGPSTGRVVVDIQQPPRRGRGTTTAGASAGGERKPRKAKGKPEKTTPEVVPQAPRRRKRVKEVEAIEEESVEEVLATEGAIDVDVEEVDSTVDAPQEEASGLVPEAQAGEEQASASEEQPAKE